MGHWLAEQEGEKEASVSCVFLGRQLVRKSEKLQKELYARFPLGSLWTRLGWGQRNEVSFPLEDPPAQRVLTAKEQLPWAALTAPRKVLKIP